MDQTKFNPSPEVDDYIASQPPLLQTRLSILRALIHETIPGLTEKMAYGIPTFQLHGRNLVHIGASASHVGWYPGPDAIVRFREELTAYRTSKGTVQLPLDEELPLELLRTMLIHLEASAPPPKVPRGRRTGEGTAE